jgi:hypothetical protein
VKISDVLFLAYRGHYSSSVMLTKAAIYEKPVIVNEGFCMGMRVKKYNLGITVPDGSVEACSKAIDALLGEDGARADRDFEGYRRAHSFKRLEEQMEKLLGGSVL